MSVTIPIRAIELTPGSTISIHNLSWQDFEQLLAELGELKAYWFPVRQSAIALNSIGLDNRPAKLKRHPFLALVTSTALL